MPRLTRHFVLALLLAAPLPSTAALHSPKRPGSPEAATIAPRQPNAQRSNNRTYLAMVGPAALAFSDVELPLPPEPVMPELPKPKIDSVKAGPVANPNGTPSTDTAPTTSTGEAPNTNAQPNDGVGGPKPISILPDDTRREIRAEDVLPYFQFPGAADSNLSPTVIINQAPAAAPPSTATYRQQ